MKELQAAERALRERTSLIHTPRLVNAPSSRGFLCRDACWVRHNEISQTSNWIRDIRSMN